MKYKKTLQAIFLERPNRFEAYVLLNNEKVLVHVKNTGRCKELLLPNSTVILEEADNPNRKTKYDLIAVYKKNLGLVNIDSQAPNKIVKEWLESGDSPFNNITYLKPECVYGKSRVDFYLECEDKKRIFIEVKGCTFEINKEGYFPDAPTARGVKHLQELTGALKEGYECYIAFVITMPEVNKVYPNAIIDPTFAEAYNKAVEAGVGVINLTCEVKENEVKYDS